MTQDPKGLANQEETKVLIEKGSDVIMDSGVGNRLRFLGCALGIFVCYFYFGILQERITRGKYVTGDTEERFTCIMSLVFVLCAVNYVYAVVVSALVLKQGRDETAWSYYAVSSFTYLTAMVTSNKALTWVNYPTQVVGKSCKPIPVMVLGVVIGRKRYPLLKYLFVLTIVAGVALFMYKDGGGSKSAASAAGGGMFGLGEILLLVSLTCDGLTGAVQERMKAEYGTKSGHMMKAMNLWSCLYLGIGLVVTGELWEFVAFVSRHPSIVWQLASVSAASALGQYFIFMCVSEFGPLPCSLVTTTRKFFTVLGSVVIFGNTLTTRQWVGAAFVFTGLILDGVYGKSKPKQETKTSGD